jgi:hypothetical protein
MKIATTYLGATLHETWSGALPSAAKPGTAAATFDVLSLPPSTQAVFTKPHLAGVVVPLTAADLMSLTRVGPQLQRATTGQLTPALIAALSTVSVSINDVIKLEHPDWKSGLDPVLNGIAIVVSFDELYEALKGKDSALKVLAGAQLGANVLDIVANVAESTGTFAAAAPAVHGVCIVVRTASSLTKIVLDAKGAAQH